MLVSYLRQIDNIIKPSDFHRMANQMPSSKQLRSIRNEFIVNGLDLFKDAGFDDDTLDSSVFAAPYIDSASDDDTKPVRYMQTEIQKRRNQQNLEKRRLLQSIRRLRRADKEKLQEITLPSGELRKVWRGGIQRKKRQMKDPFKNLPSDVLLDIMRQTSRDDFVSLMEASPAAEDLYSGNENACIRGIEVEQYGQQKWLFGDSKHRTAEQKQALKDWIGTYYYTFRERPTVVEDFGRIDDGKLTGPESLKYLAQVQESLVGFTKSLEDITHNQITSRTALCLQALSMRKATVVKSTSYNWVRRYTGLMVSLSEMPSEDRIRLFKRQPPMTQNEIRSIFEKIIIPIVKEIMDLSLADWIWEYYTYSWEVWKEVEEMGAWLTSLAVGMVMQTVLEHPGESMDSWMSRCSGILGASRVESIMIREEELEAQSEEDFLMGRKFAEAIGFDGSEVLVGTPMEDTMNKLIMDRAEDLQNL